MVIFQVILLVLLVLSLVIGLARAMPEARKRGETRQAVVVIICAYLATFGLLYFVGAFSELF